MTLTICVFCSARKAEPAVEDTARALGRAIARRGHRLVYGGTAIGVMGTLARAAAGDGAETIGVIPDFLVAKEGDLPVLGQRTIVTTTLAERKQRMIAMSDVFVALPGGYGTLDEVLEVISTRSLGQHTKPLLLLDSGGGWNSFAMLGEELLERGTAAQGAGHLFHVFDDVEKALVYAETVVTMP